MRNKLRFIGIIALAAAVFAFAFAGCENGTTNPSDSPGGSNPSPVIPPSANLAPALRAIPVPADSSGSDPKVLDSYTDGTKNWYLIDVGHIRNMYVSTIGIAHFNGMTPMSLTRTTISQRTITEGLTETVSSSVTVSNTQTGKVGLDLAYEKKVPFVSKFSAKISLEWTGSWTKSNTSARSTETSVSTAESFADSQTVSFTIGENNEPAGYYRYGLYAVSDVYFVISTSLDNQDLLSWDTVVCARENTYLPNWDFSLDGVFDNSPIENDITFAEDFHTALPQPEVSDPGGSFLSHSTDWEVVRTAEHKITDSGWQNQPVDAINFNQFLDHDSKPINLNTMRTAGYRTISFYIRMEVREYDDGYQRILLCNTPSTPIGTVEFEHGPGRKDTNWRFHFEDKLKFENISIDVFAANDFFITYSARGSGTDAWGTRNLQVRLLFDR